MQRTPTAVCRWTACSLFICLLSASLYAEELEDRSNSRSDVLSGISVREALADWRMGGSLSFNWRGVGPREPGFETQIQHEVFLADIYFDFHGPVIDGVPVRMEFNMPTSGRGTPQLYQFFFEYDRIKRWDFRLGKFLVPFGTYNELYRPDMFLTITRPLLYASPDSLDLVVRINSPRPPFSSGYTDVGARVSFYPRWQHPSVPSELTLFVVNGLGESNNRLRTFPSPENLGITPTPVSGSTLDFDHSNNNLADNNNSKSPGGRIVWALGSLDLPWPVPEGRRDINGVLFGISAMGGQYNLEAQLNYRMFGMDLGFEYEGLGFSAEYMYSYTQFQSALVTAPNSHAILTNPINFHKDFEEIYGYFVQAAVPLWRQPWKGKVIRGIFVFNQLVRSGPNQTLIQNVTIGGTTFDSIAAFDPSKGRLKTSIQKYTGALHWQLTNHFSTKLEYSYWAMGDASTFSPTTDINQSALSFVMAF